MANEQWPVISPDAGERLNHIQRQAEAGLAAIMDVATSAAEQALLADIESRIMDGRSWTASDVLLIFSCFGDGGRLVGRDAIRNILGHFAPAGFCGVF